MRLPRQGVEHAPSLATKPVVFINCSVGLTKNRTLLVNLRGFKQNRLYKYAAAKRLKQLRVTKRALVIIAYGTNVCTMPQYPDR